MWVQFPLSALYRGVIAMVAGQAHNLKVRGSSPLPATNFTKYGRDRKGKDDKDQKE